MPDNPFSNPAFAALGGQMAQMWQKSLDAWWKSLLSDRGRLLDLSRRLGETAGGQGADAADLAKVIEALELLEQRLAKVEQQVTTLGGTVEAMVSYLEKDGSK
ncbi:MAG: hypothetical protein ABI333_23600 [bacterium]